MDVDRENWWHRGRMWEGDEGPNKSHHSHTTKLLKGNQKLPHGKKGRNGHDLAPLTHGLTTSPNTHATKPTLWVNKTTSHTNKKTSPIPAFHIGTTRKRMGTPPLEWKDCSPVQEEQLSLISRVLIPSASAKGLQPCSCTLTT